jgi:hypothetical protein
MMIITIFIIIFIFIIIIIIIITITIIIIMIIIIIIVIIKVNPKGNAVLISRKDATLRKAPQGKATGSTRIIGTKKPTMQELMIEEALRSAKETAAPETVFAPKSMAVDFRNIVKHADSDD